MHKSLAVGRRFACLALLPAAILLNAEPASQNAFAQNEPPQDQPQAILLDDQSFDGKLIAADDWNFTFDVNGRHKKISAADLLRWGRPAAIKRAPVVVLADGGLLRADTVKFDGTAATVASAAFGDVAVPRELLAGLVFELPIDTADADRILDWTANLKHLATNAKRTHNTRTTGQIRLINGDRLTGRILRVDDGKVRIETEIGPIETDRRRVQAIRFAAPHEKALPLIAARPDIKAWIGLSDGSLLLARRLSLDAKKLALSLCGDPNQKSEWHASPQDLVFLQTIGPKATYLSDLEAAEYRHVPYLQLPWPYGIDRNATGGRLRAGGRLFIKGLGVHSSARLTYLFDKPYSKFKASTAIDDSTAGRGGVRFRLYLDGQKKYAGQIVRGQDAPTPVSLDIRGAKRLDLIVDFGDRADQQDHADWLEARLLP